MIRSNKLGGYNEEVLEDHHVTRRSIKFYCKSPTISPLLSTAIGSARVGPTTDFGVAGTAITA